MINFRLQVDDGSSLELTQYAIKKNFEAKFVANWNFSDSFGEISGSGNALDLAIDMSQSWKSFPEFWPSLIQLLKDLLVI